MEKAKSSLKTSLKELHTMYFAFSDLVPPRKLSYPRSLLILKKFAKKCTNARSVKFDRTDIR